MFALLQLLASPGRGEPTDSPTTSTQRLIACAPNLVEIVYALGAGDRLVGISRYADWPPEAAALPQVVDLYNANFELMLQLQPTHVLTIPSNSNVVEFFRKHGGPEVIQTGPIETFDEIDAAILLLGERLGLAAQAEELVARRPKPREVPQGKRPRVLFVVGRSGSGLSQLYVVGRGTYLDELLSGAGADNVVPAELGLYPVLNKEALLRYNPEIIIEMCAPDGVEQCREETLRAWKTLATIKAVKRGDFRFVTDGGIMKPGPRAAEYQALLEDLLWGEEN